MDALQTMSAQTCSWPAKAHDVLRIVIIWQAKVLTNVPDVAVQPLVQACIVQAVGVDENLEMIPFLAA